MVEEASEESNWRHGNNERSRVTKLVDELRSNVTNNKLNKKLYAKALLTGGSI